MQKYTFFFTINFWSKPLLKISTFVHLRTKKYVKPRIGLIDQKRKNKCLEVIFMQKSTYFITIDFWSKPLLKILTFVHLCTKKCVKPRIGLIDQKIEKQMSRSDFYAKIYISLYYHFLIQAFIENFDLCTLLYLRVHKVYNWAKWHRNGKTNV